MQPQWGEAGGIGTGTPGDWRFGPPSPQLVPVQQPAAGSTWTLDLPREFIAKVLSVTAVLTTSTAVANRRPRLRASAQTGTRIYTVTMGVNVAASATRTMTWAVGLDYVAGTDAHLANALPDILLPPGSTLTMPVAAIAAGDQISAVAVLVQLI